MNNKIKLLDELTINRIAAGEVIERPSSIVKELVENSLDAKSENIKIEIEDGGKRRIIITDDGFGINKLDLPLAPLQFSTSKITQLDDIYNQNSMGFRGEALASIRYVARLKIISKTNDAENAYELEANPEIGEIKITNRTPGTTVIVEDLFSKVPVRKKYLRSSNTEFSYIYDVVQKFSLIYPQKNFILYQDKKEILNTTGLNDLYNLILYFFGKDLKNHLININSEIKNLKINGIISKPEISFPNRNKEIISVNGRYIKNHVLQKVLTDIYRDLIPNRKFPLFILDIQIPPTLIDVNIHPQKLDIKFLDYSFIFDNLYKLLKSYLEERKILNESELDPNFKSYLLTREEKIDFSFEPEKLVLNNPSLFADFDSDSSKIPTADKENNYFNMMSNKFFQIFNTYLIINAENELWLIDQHAAHERLIYQQIKNNQIKMPIIPLLIPEVIEFEVPHYQIIKDNITCFQKIFLSIEDFGINQLLIREIPKYLENVNLKNFLLELIDNLEKMPIDFLKDSKLESFEKTACKSAVKAKMKLTEFEIQELIKNIISSNIPLTCPHGRPFLIKITKDDLEKMFLRK